MAPFAKVARRPSAQDDRRNNAVRTSSHCSLSQGQIDESGLQRRTVVRGPGLHGCSPPRNFSGGHLRTRVRAVGAGCDPLPGPFHRQRPTSETAPYSGGPDLPSKRRAAHVWPSIQAAALRTSRPGVGDTQATPSWAAFLACRHSTGQPSADSQRSASRPTPRHRRRCRRPGPRASPAAAGRNVSPGRRLFTGF
jgi:hypothetical protein